MHEGGDTRLWPSAGRFMFGLMLNRISAPKHLCLLRMVSSKGRREPAVPLCRKALTSSRQGERRWTGDETPFPLAQVCNWVQRKPQ